MTASNWIEIVIIVVLFSALIMLRVWTKRKLDSIDGLGKVRRVRDVANDNMIDLDDSSTTN